MYRTGFCDIGNHEGLEPVSASGKPMKVCTFIETCECECHAELNMMYEIRGKDRVVRGNPKYEPYTPTFWMPSVDDSTPSPLVASSPTPAGGPRTLELPAATGTGAVRGLAPAARVFAPTPSGKRARGLLEDEVLYVCRRFLEGDIDGPLTPKAVAAAIDEYAPPSVGAIASVFDRWVALGFAECEKKPVRFVCLTVPGMRDGLEKMKADAKRRGRQGKDATRRGERN